MAGTLTNSALATSFQFLNNDRLSTASSIKTTSNVCIKRRNGNTPKALLHSIIDDPKMRSTSLYDVLNVKINATPSEIKYAYRSLAKRYHPDATYNNLKRNDDRDFIGIHDAYVTLSDPTARAMYDLKMSSGFAGKRSGFAGQSWETDQCW